MRSVLPFDEINQLNESIRKRFKDKEQIEPEDILDEMLDLFLLTYATANRVTGESLGYEYEPTTEEVMETVNKTVAGETWRQRAEDYLENGGSAEDLVRIVETESHRIANESSLRTAGKAGATKKKWVTMLDDKVRDTHIYLEGQTVPYDADFYTFDGDHARAPGLFTLPENNINCRCELIFEK